jgi:pyridoxal phosphate enzyme (YggS family)
MTPGDIAGNVARVRERIERACARGRREPGSVRLIAVTKTHPVAIVDAAYAAGVRDFGESRVQEALPKIAAARAAGVEATWHLIGHLQTNKTAAAIDAFDILHSVDSIRLAEALSRRAARKLKVLLEVNVAREASKEGVVAADLPAFLREVRQLANLEVAGLMSVAPRVENPEQARPVFRRLRELRDELGVGELSMGMTGDFEVAIEEGATMVRVGRALFGERQGR